MKDLEEPLEYVGELPAAAQLTAAGLFVQQHFFFAAIRSVHTQPDLLLVRFVTSVSRFALYNADRVGWYTSMYTGTKPDIDSS